VSEPEPAADLPLAKIPLSRCKPPKRHAAGPLQLTIAQILAWADDHHARTGTWPNHRSGPLPATLAETWARVYKALYQGLRGLPGGSSLARLLAEHRGVRNQRDLPRLTEHQILAWADAWHSRTGQWPSSRLREDVPEAPGECWYNIGQALHGAGRGLPGGDTLARLLARERGVRNPGDLPPLTEGRILRWCRAHHRRTGAWPTAASGEVQDAPGESWVGVNGALRTGGRGFPGNTTLAQLVGDRLGVRNRASLPRLTVEQILKWADAHKRRTGQWPRMQSGALADVPDETWLAIDTALRKGLRRLPAGDSLARLLARKRGVRNKVSMPPLTEVLILRWADDHHRRMGKWPAPTSGPVRAAPDQTWCAVNQALYKGGRGLPGGDSLARLFERRRGVRPRASSSARLTEAMILEWANEHNRRMGSWPRQDSGPVLGAPGETWAGIQASLYVGRRGLPGGDTIVRLLARHGR
jgi:hypothetical protein